MFVCSIGYSSSTVCSNYDPGLTLTYFTARSNLVPYAFIWDKDKTMDFSEITLVYDIKYYQLCSNGDPGLTLTYFTAVSNLVPSAFVWGKR